MPDHLTIQSWRLRLSEFEMSDATDVYNCITPAITHYMFWEPPPSFAAYKARREAVLQSGDKRNLSFVVRRLDTAECLGIASLDHIHTRSPELGVWLKEAAQNNGYGSEAVRAMARWAFEALGKERFTYAAATQNIPSRRIAEALGGRSSERARARSSTRSCSKSPGEKADRHHRKRRGARVPVVAALCCP